MKNCDVSPAPALMSQLPPLKEVPSYGPGLRVDVPQATNTARLTPSTFHLCGARKWGLFYSFPNLKDYTDTNV